MKYVYKYGIYAKIISILITLLSLSGCYRKVSEGISKHNILELLFGLVFVPVLLYFIVGVFLARAIVSERGIRVESGKLAPPRELLWEEIGDVVDDSWMGLHMYHLLPRVYGKKIIHLNSLIMNFKDILAEVMERAPHARVDYEIKMMIENYKKSARPR